MVIRILQHRLTKPVENSA